MRQYCRYCAFCIDGDSFYCTELDKVLTRGQIRRENSCARFALSELGDVETGKMYSPRPGKRDDGMEQVTMLE